MSQNLLKKKCLLLSTCLIHFTLSFNSAEAGVGFSPVLQARADLLPIELPIEEKFSVVIEQPKNNPLEDLQEIIPSNSEIIKEIDCPIQEVTAESTPVLFSATSNPEKAVIPLEELGSLQRLIKDYLERIETQNKELEIKNSLLQQYESERSQLEEYRSLNERNAEKIAELNQAIEYLNLNTQDEKRINELKLEIERLNALLAHRPEVKAQIISPKLQEDIANVKKEIIEKPRINFAEIEATLENIKAEESVKGVVELNDFLMTQYQEASINADEKKIEDLEKALQKMTDHGYVGKILEQQQLHNVQQAISERALEGTEHFNRIKDEGSKAADKSPNVILTFLSPKLLKTLSAARLIDLKDLLKYSSKEDLLALLHYLVNIAKIELKSLNTEGKPLEAYLLTVHNAIEDFRMRRNLVTRRQGDDGHKAAQIIRELKENIEIDSNAENRFLVDYQAEHTLINQAGYIAANKAVSPLLTLLEKDKAKLDEIPGNIVSLLLNYTKYTNLDELKSLIYHFANLKLFTTGTGDSKQLARTFSRQLNERIKNRVIAREALQRAEAAEFTNRIERWL